MKKSCNNLFSAGGYSLVEVLVALTMSSMILVAVLGIYGRAQQSAGAITRQLDQGQMVREILQRISEDLDRIITPGDDTRIVIRNKFENGYSTAHLSIAKAVRTGGDRVETFERVIWQGSYDPESEKDGLVLYRKHHGIVPEDKILSKSKEQWERELFVPVCDGITYFTIEIPDGNDFLDEWTVDKLPTGITVTVSLGVPFKTVSGDFDVADEEKVSRTIAIDRSRKIAFNLAKLDYETDSNDMDANSIDANNVESKSPRER